MDDQRSMDDVHISKRMKMEHDVEMEKIKANERSAQMKADSQRGTEDTGGATEGIRAYCTNSS